MPKNKKLIFYNKKKLIFIGTLVILTKFYSILIKNYYYFLGIPKDATLGDIKNAYRKLSNKYHPDKNPQDVFFHERFLEVKEAYDVLSDEDKRRIFDHNLEQFRRGYKTYDLPKIVKFRSNQIRAVKGEKIVLSWFTENADFVKLVPIGLVDAQGEKTFEIQNFENHQIIFLLHATNSLTKKTIVERLIVQEIENSTRFEEQDIQSNESEIEHKKPQQKISKKLMYIIVLFLLIILIFVSIFINQINTN